MRTLKESQKVHSITINNLHKFHCEIEVGGAVKTTIAQIENIATEAMEWKDTEWRKVLDRVLRAWQANKSFKEFEKFLIKNFGNEQRTTN
jgi:hypothetical protein